MTEEFQRPAWVTELMKVKATPEDEEMAACFVTSGYPRDLLSRQFAAIRLEERKKAAQLCYDRCTKLKDEAAVTDRGWIRQEALYRESAAASDCGDAILRQTDRP